MKKCLTAKEEELWKLKYISPCKNIIFQKSSKGNPKSFKRYYNSIITTNLQVPTPAKNIIFQKSSYKN
jgi:hypothetical protein